MYGETFYLFIKVFSRAVDNLDQLAKPTFRSRYAFTEQSEGPMDTVVSIDNIEFQTISINIVTRFRISTSSFTRQWPMYYHCDPTL